MSHKIGKNNQRNRDNRVKFYPYHEFPGVVSNGIVTLKSGRKYLISTRGNWTRINA